MISRRARQNTIATLGIVNLLLVICFSAWSQSLIQDDKRKVVRPFTLVSEPLEVGIEYRGKSIEANEEFEGDADWLNALKFKLTNKSQKAITFIELGLSFPDTVLPGKSSVALHLIHLGISPDLHIGSPFHLGLGESRQISLDTDYSAVKKLVESRVPVENVKSVVLRIDRVLFDDDTLFAAGVVYRRNPNPNYPHKWIPIDK